MIEITCAEAPIFAQIVNRNFANLGRISKLISDFNENSNQDLLRLCIVYMHASVEDLLRNVSFYYLTTSNPEEVLGKIPLHSSDGKKEKFNFSDLMIFKNDTVTEIFIKSCEEYVNRLTFNNTNDIILVFKKFNVSHKEIEPLLPIIQNVFLRRHLVVHNLDLSICRNSLHQNETVLHNGTVEIDDKLEKEKIEEWLNTVSQFMLKTTIAFLPEGVSIILKNS